MALQNGVSNMCASLSTVQSNQPPLPPSEMHTYIRTLLARLLIHQLALSVPLSINSNNFVSNVGIRGRPRDYQIPAEHDTSVLNTCRSRRNLEMVAYSGKNILSKRHTSHNCCGKLGKTFLKILKI